MTLAPIISGGAAMYHILMRNVLDGSWNMEAYRHSIDVVKMLHDHEQSSRKGTAFQYQVWDVSYPYACVTRTTENMLRRYRKARDRRRK
jgi:hypothetical protein